MVRADLNLDEDGGGEEPEPPPLLMFYPADYALDTWFYFKKHGVWPEGSCYNDQDEQLMLQWRSFNARYNWWFARLRRESEGGGDPFERMLAETHNAPSVDKLFSE